MATQISHESDPDLKLKVKKNLVYVSIFSIVMIFAGLTSAYIVSMGDSFWVKYPLPSGFWFSTISIILSSLTYIIATKQIKKNQFSSLKIWMILTFVLGLLFVYFQWKGYGQLVEKGANMRNSIMVTEGKYGDYFEIKYLNQFIEVNANDYLVNGKILNDNQYDELEKFMSNFYKAGELKGFRVDYLSPKFVLYFKGQPIVLKNNKLTTSDGNELPYLDRKRLQYLAWNIRDKRGDFFYKGKLGKDFKLYYKGKELTYKNRNLYYKGKILSAPLQIKINQASDTATSYLYIITFLHLLHIIAAIIYLFRMVLITFKPSLSFDNQISIRMGGIFWHFLGILWLYLLVFLLFIH